MLSVLPPILDVNRVCPLAGMELVQNTNNRLPLMAGISIHCDCIHHPVVRTTGAAEFYCVCQIASTRRSAEMCLPIRRARPSGSRLCKARETCVIA